MLKETRFEKREKRKRKKKGKMKMVGREIFYRLKHWIFQARKKKCGYCCLKCEFWDLCKGDKDE